MTARVFVINEPLRADGSPLVSLKPAEFFGSVIHILPAGKPPADPMESLPRIEEVLADYREGDFIVLVGEMDLVALAVAVALEANEGRVNFLKWDRNNRAYFPQRAKYLCADET